MVPGMDPVNHPAKFSIELYPVLRKFLEDVEGNVLDPFAGVGRIHELHPRTVGVELEEEWALQHGKTIVGNALHLPFPDDSFEAIASSPCYGNRLCLAEGTLVTTWRGQVPIQDVTLDDLVLTHRGRWKRVSGSWFAGVKDTVKVVGQGARQLVCTPDHRLRTCDDVSKRHDHVRMGEPRWTEAQKAVGEYWVVPAQSPEGAVPVDWSTDFWWLVGLWLGDGWIERRNRQRKRKHGSTRTNWIEDRHVATGLGFCANTAQSDRFHERLVAATDGQISGWRVSGPAGEPSKVVRASLNSVELAKTFESLFGSGAFNKNVPGWTLSLSEEKRRSLLDGWLAADGHYDDRGSCQRWLGVSVSRPLIRGMQLLAASVGYSTSVAKQNKAGREFVVGRWCDVKDSYTLSLTSGGSKRSHRIDEGWAHLIREVLPSGQARTYDLSVEGDNSFVAEGVVVHNSDTYTDHTRRITYTAYLGRKLSDDSAGAMQWGKKYRTFHEAAWIEASRVGRSRFVLNCKNHIRKGEIQPVTEWHIETLKSLGWKHKQSKHVETPGHRDGENHEARIDYETVALFTR